MTHYGSPYPNPAAPQSPQPKKRKWPWVAGTLGALVVLGIAVNAGGSDEPSSAAQAPTTSSSAPATTTKPQLTDAEREKYNQQAQQRAAERSAEAARQAEAQRAAEAAKQDRSTYEAISDRDFALLVKNPEGFTGRKFVLYGRVSQFDSATGPSTFRADAAASPQEYWGLYGENVVVTGSSRMLTDVVEDDLVTMYVEVAGAYSYDTQIGGSTTAPKLTVNIIDVTGTDN